jgi:hypothetical protein
VPDISKIKAAIAWQPQRDLTQILSDVAHHITNS